MSALARLSPELCDAVVIGSGFGGAIPACRLAQAGQRVVILERGPYLGVGDFNQDLSLGTIGRIVDAIKCDGMTVIAGNCVGGSSVVYFGASLRAPSYIFDRTAGTGRRVWPDAITRSTLDPFYDLAERMLPVSQQSWNDVSYAGGVFAAACDRTGHSANPVPLAVDLASCVNCNWMLTGCRFDAKRSMLLNYLPIATRHGAQIRPLSEVQLITPATSPGYAYRVSYLKLDPDDYRLPVSAGCIEAKVVVLAAGAMGTPVILRRSAPFLGGVPDAVGKYLSGNGDRIFVADVDEGRAHSVLGLERTGSLAYEAHHIGKSITAMSYDYLDSLIPEGHRAGLQQIALPAIINLLPGAPSWFGRDKKALRARWRSWLTLLAMTEDRGTGFLAGLPPTGSFTRLTQGFGVGPFEYRADATTRAGWAEAEIRLRHIFETDGVATVRPLAEEPSGVVSAHPLGTCRLGDDDTSSALNGAHELRGAENLFVTDASAIPTSLTVNPSLTVAALAERASQQILARL